MSEFVDSLHEAFERFGRIEARRMFGGHGIYHDGRMFALVVGETLYLKSDAESAAHFDRLKLHPFEYHRQGKTMQMSYRQAPADIFEDRDEAAVWARRAYESALRSGQPPKEKNEKSRAARKTAPRKPAAKTAPRKPAARR